MLRADCDRDGLDAGAERLAQRIRGWCLKTGCDLGEMARRAGVSRTTVYHLLGGRTQRPHYSTLNKIAAALEIPAERLQGGESAPEPEPAGRVPRAVSIEQRAFDRGTNPLIAEVCAERPELFTDWSPDDWDELYSTFGTGGPLSREGVTDAAERMNRQRETLQQLHVVLETHLADVAAEMVATLYRMVCPDASSTPDEPAPPEPTRRKRKGRLRGAAE